MDEKRLAKISEDALDEEDFAYGILIGENNYDGADGARTVRKLCGYIGELLAHIRAQQAQLAAVPVEAINRYWRNSSAPIFDEQYSGDQYDEDYDEIEPWLILQMAERRSHDAHR